MTGRVPRLGSRRCQILLDFLFLQFLELKPVRVGGATAPVQISVKAVTTRGGRGLAIYRRGTSAQKSRRCRPLPRERVRFHAWENHVKMHSVSRLIAVYSTYFNRTNRLPSA